MTEADGDIAKAADILQELQVKRKREGGRIQWLIECSLSLSLSLSHTQVETYGSMEREEKVMFVIEQMRLCLAKKDYIRAQIISKKVSTKFFKGDTDTIQVMGKYFLTFITPLPPFTSLSGSKAKIL